MFDRGNDEMDAREYESKTFNIKNLVESVTQGFKLFDERLSIDAKLMQDASGSTALVCFVEDRHILCANAGDSRCIIVLENGDVVPMSVDHKPTRHDERVRILSARHRVMMERVDGNLAVSRGLGDYSFKDQAHLDWSAQAVTAKPEIQVYSRTDRDLFLVMACDGIWDVITSEQAGSFLVFEHNQGVRDVKALAENLVRYCYSRGSLDNMSVIITRLVD